MNSPQHGWLWTVEVMLNSRHVTMASVCFVCDRHKSRVIYHVQCIIAHSHSGTYTMFCRAKMWCVVKWVITRKRIQERESRY